ncbi:MAG TPA: ABC transporter permease, partial [Vicinamibacteria bacterium]|nr:ABC transporter permease [Vicinamibacteria bacterium]
MASLGRELRHAWRGLAKQPAFTAIAVATMALGIGAATAIFSLVDAVLLRPLALPEPERLVQVWETFRPAGLAADAPDITGTASPPNLRDWREQSDVFEGLAAYTRVSVSLREADRPVRTPAAAVSPEFFEVLGARPLLGRTFGAAEDAAGETQVAVLDEVLWRRSFGADPGVVGSKLRIDGLDHTILGVMPSAARQPPQVDLWMPLTIDASRRDERGNHWLRVLGRLRPGVPLAAAQQQMSGIAARLASAHPDNQGGRGVVLVPLQEQLVGNVRPALRLFLAAVGLVLLTCCFNVSNLLLARAAARQRETAVRVALGAGLMGLARQFVVEGLVLAGLGGLAGVALAQAGLGLALDHVADVVPRVHEVHLDLRALGVALAAVVLSGVGFGLAPLRRAFRRDANEALKQGARGSSGSTASGLLVAGQVAITTLLLIGAGLLLRSLGRVMEVDSGVRTKGVTTARLTLPLARRADGAAVRAFHRRVLERVETLPGVEAAGLINLLPLQASGYNGDVVPEGQTFPPGQAPLAERRFVTPGYFRALGIPLVRGRLLTEEDAEGEAPLVMVNERLAERFWPDQDPIGRRIQVGDTEYRTIVGVVRDVRQVTLAQDARAEVYMPAQPRFAGNLRTASLVVRATPAAGDVGLAIRRAVEAVDPEQPVYDVQTMERVVEVSVADRRL